MNFAVAAVGVLLAFTTHAAPRAAAPRGSHGISSRPTPAAPPLTAPLAPAGAVTPTPLPMLPRVARVRVEAARDHVLLIEEVIFPRGDWEGGGFDFAVAFGAPGTPIAMDAQLVPLASGALESRLEDVGETVPLEPTVRRTGATVALLGRPQMAGVVVHLKDAALRRALAPSGAAALRIRSLLRAPAADPSGARAVVVRLGMAGGLPLTLGHIQVVSLEHEPGLVRAEAALCGPEAETWPLATTLLPRPAARASREPPSIAPEMAVRHPTDDLCIRWWGGP